MTPSVASQGDANLRDAAESKFGFTGKSNGLDSWVLLEVTSVLFVYGTSRRLDGSEHKE